MKHFGFWIFDFRLNSRTDGGRAYLQGLDRRLAKASRLAKRLATGCRAVRWGDRRSWGILAIPIFVSLCLCGEIRAGDRETLMTAMERIESDGDASAVGDGGAAVGILQIHPVMVAEANRILGCRKFRLADRWSRSRSEEMFRVVTSSVLWRGLSDEQISRRWNQGGRWRNAAAAAYWLRVQSAIENRKSKMESGRG